LAPPALASPYVTPAATTATDCRSTCFRWNSATSGDRLCCFLGGVLRSLPFGAILSAGDVPCYHGSSASLSEGALDSRLGLPVNTLLDGSYRIERVVGSGGFGITYEAEDINLATKVAIKEYYPFDF